MEENKSEGSEDLKPKPPPKRAPRGIRSFTVCRQHDETGVSGEGVIIRTPSFQQGGIVTPNIDNFLRSLGG